MRGRRRMALLAAVLVLLIAGCATFGTRSESGLPDRWAGRAPGGTSGMFVNPVYSGNAADPQAIQVDGVWYLVHTNEGGRNVPLLTSTDLVTWTPGGDALPTLPGWAAPGRTWAPEIIALSPDRYLLYYTATERASGRQCIGRAVATTPRGPYRDDSAAPLVCPADQGGAIDASPFRDDDGSLWLLWKNDGNAIGVDTWLWSQRLAPDGTQLVGTPVRLLRQEADWEGPVIEAPFLWRRDGRLFLFFAANAFDTSGYAEGYATCATPAGPCAKGPENPILRANAVASGPGHAFMVTAGGRDWLLYHAWRPGTEGTDVPGRQLWLDEVTWDGGRPRVHGPTATPQPRPLPAEAA